jgi:hypothetical protein
MVQLIETDPLPGGGTRLKYRIAYEPPAIFARLVPPIQWAFKHWFEISLERLALLVDGKPSNGRSGVS